MSHMKYNLYTSKEQWDSWHQQLAKFWKSFDRARRQREGQLITPVRPTLQIPLHLPSPPASTHPSPPYVSAVSPNTSMFANAPILNPTLEYPSQHQPRKRSHDSDEPPAKRQSRSGRATNTAMAAVYGRSSSTSQASHSAVPILPIPSSAQQAYANARISMAFQPGLSFGRNTPPTGIHLPSANWLAGIPPPAQQPLQTPTGAVPDHTLRQHTPSTVPAKMARTSSNSGYTAGSVLPPPSMHPLTTSLAPTTPVYHNLSPLTATAHSTTSYFSTPIYSTTPTSSSSVIYPAPTPQHPPGPVYPSAASHTLQPDRLSPSHYLTNRSSPYRPVRNMHTLLVEPPSNNMPQHPAQITQDQMRWQPLSKQPPSKPADERTGRVPYLHREAWPQTHQFNQWPSLYTTQI